MKKTINLTSIFISLWFCGTAAVAGELDTIQKVSQSFPHELKPEFIDKPPIQGLYILSNQRGSFMLDSSGKYLIHGAVFDLNTEKNINNAVYQQHYAINSKQLPLNQAFKEVKGNGKRIIYVFADPDCPACQMAQSFFEELDNITIYTFPFALPHLHPDALTTAKKIWCSKEPLKAWINYLVDDQAPKQQSTDCINPIDLNMKLTQKLNISVTPTIFNAAGQRMTGMSDEEEFENFIEVKKVKLN